MPAQVKPLFRPEALRPMLGAFHPPPATVAGRGKLLGWLKLLASARGAKRKETELLPDFIRDVFGETPGYTGPAGGSADYTIKRESLVEVDGESTDTAFTQFANSEDASEMTYRKCFLAGGRSIG